MRLRHGPVGIGLEAVHHRLDLRRRILGRADDHQALEHALAAVDEYHRVVAGVDQHVAAAEILGQPAPALEVGDDLLDAVVDRGVERARGVGADHAVDRQSLGLLVGLHHGRQRLVVEVGRRAAGRRHGEAEFAQPRAQDRHARIGHAGLQQVAAGQRRVGRSRRAWRAGRPAPSAAPGSRPWAAAMRGRPRKSRRLGGGLQQVGALDLALLDVDVLVDAVGVDAAGRDVAGIGDEGVGDQQLGASPCRLGRDSRRRQRSARDRTAVPVGIEAMIAGGADRLEERFGAGLGGARSGPQGLRQPGMENSQAQRTPKRRRNKLPTARRNSTRAEPATHAETAIIFPNGSVVWRFCHGKSMTLQERRAGRRSPAA